MGIALIIGLILVFVIATVVVKAYGDQIAGLLPRIKTDETKKVTDVLPNQVSESLNLQQEI